jgi:hypothetical protein
MRLAFTERLRAWTQLLDKRLGGRHWFPHVPLALLLGLGGLWILNARFGGDWSQYAHALMQGDFHLNLRLLPSLLIGGGMVTMAFGLLWRSRLAWVMAVLLAATGSVNTLLTGIRTYTGCSCTSRSYWQRCYLPGGTLTVPASPQALSSH